MTCTDVYTIYSMQVIYSAEAKISLRKPFKLAELAWQQEVFAGYICKLIYDSVDFQVSEVIREGSEFSDNYNIIGYIIMT